MSTRSYGWRPSPLDSRNFVTETAGTAPTEYDPRKGGGGPMPSVVDQFQIGSCTANAFRTALLRAYKDSLAEVSRLHIYGGERTIEGTFSEDSGAYGHDAFRYARRHGVAAETQWPYGDGSTFANTAKYALATASTPKVHITQYSHPHPDLETFKLVLAAGKYICQGFTVYESFESSEVARTGIVPLPQRGERILGGHEVCAVGYTAAGDFICQNSWGDEWGQEGFFIFPAAYMFGFGTSDWRVIDQV